MGSLFRRLAAEEDGQNLVEYALLGALVALVVMATLTNVGTGVISAFNNLVAVLG